MLPTSAGVEPATSWSSVGRRIQLSHRGKAYVFVKEIGYIQKGGNSEMKNICLLSQRWALLKERICSSREQILYLMVSPIWHNSMSLMPYDNPCIVSSKANVFVKEIG